MTRGMTASSLVSGFRLRNLEKGLGVYGIHVHREGREPVEHRFRNDDPVHLYSGSKAFTAAAVGMACAEGLLSLDDRVTDFFPRYHHSERGTQMTVRHLLQMSSGNPFTWRRPGQLDTEDLLGAFLAAELIAEPGTHFEYSNGGSYTLSRIIRAVSGRDLRDFLVPRLFDPLGVRNPQWMRCPRGYSLGGVGLHLRTSEFARLGQLLLQDGAWNGERLLPDTYVEQMRTDLVDGSSFSPDPEFQAGYGYHVWRCTREEAWRADGRYGQSSIILPKHRAVVTITAHNEGIANDILRAVWDEVLPRLSWH